MSERGRISKGKYLLIYTAVFAVFALGAFFLFLKKGKSLIWNQDGGPQYYPYLIYTGRWLRDWLTRALQGDLSIRMIDFRIGFGSDVGSIVRTHPLELLSALVPAGAAEGLYALIILLRLYLAGLAFSLSASLFKPLSLYTVTGSMLYVFSGFVITLGTRHPIYGAALIMLPLLITGAERVIRREGIALLPAAAALGFISNYYFMYQATAALGVYILLRLAERLLAREAAFGIKDALRTLGRLIGLYLLGLAMAMFAMLPIVASLGASARLSSQSVPAHLLAYEGWRHYYRWLLNLLTPVRTQEGSIALNYAVTALPALGLLAGAPRKSFRVLKRSALAGLVVLLSPLCSYVLSGFSAVTGRWVYIIGYILAMAFALLGEQLAAANRRQKIWIGALSVLYLALGLYDLQVKKSVYLIWSMAAVAVLGILLLLIDRVKRVRNLAPLLLLGVTLISCTANAFFFYSGRFNGALEEYLDRGQALSLIRDSEFAKLPAGGETRGEFARTESDLVTSNKENYALLLGYDPTSVYNSVLSGPSTYYMLETDNVDLAAIHRIWGLNGRAVSDALANVGYYLTTYDGDAHAPYGFVRSEALSDGHNAVFTNQYPLAFGYTYDAFAGRSALEGLDGLEKERLMLEGAVLEDEDAAHLTGRENPALKKLDVEAASAGIVEEAVSLPESGENLKRTGEGYKVKQGGGSITLPIRRRAGYDLYVKLTDLWLDKVSTFAYVQTGDLRTMFSMRGPDYIYSLNRKDYVIRLGYDRIDRDDTLTLAFSDKGRYHLGGISLCYVPMDDYARRIEARNAASLTDLSFGVNTVSGRASVPGERLMAFSVPYSRGWSVYVDGKKAQALQVNVGWLGTYLEAGEHTVTLRYATPGARAGRLVSLAGCLLYAGLCLPRRKKKNRKTVKG